MWADDTITKAVGVDEIALEEGGIDMRMNG